ncbi:LIM/homeobox protein Awh-like [Saccostrea echinata]|uniref:LIM/homeobox protein Awh-like n=1 Tax=Saccostrea echinata TaxID=191078 RepID=UPI002A82DE91|nr:LIM/homeobox protein Awh-like [Saccostrea echinata]
MRITHGYGSDSELASYEHDEFIPSPGSEENPDKFLCTMMKSDGDLCHGCGDLITERFLLHVNGQAWHVGCLRCCICQIGLERQTSCFIREDNIYCRNDYSREFGTKCAKCYRTIQSTDWVRRARENVYHLACFACDSCKRQLSTGEEFALQGDRVLCKSHYMELLEGGSNKDSECNQKSKAKRVRTTFTEDQLQVLQANFQLDSNPDGQDLERIAQITGLSKRVTQVWFQNSRARQKKQQQGGEHTSPSSNSSPSKTHSPQHWLNGSDSQHSDSYSFSD